MNRIIRDYLNAIRKQLTHLPLREREAVLNEIQDHLTTETKRLRKEDRGLSEDEAALNATHAFGDPSEIGVAYGAGGGVVNRSTGELLLDVAILSTRAAGRGAQGVLKWTGVTVASILGVVVILIFASLLLAGTVISTFQDDIRENIPHPLYDYRGSWGLTEPHTETTTDTFDVPDGIREFWFFIDNNPGGGSPGCAMITLIDPDGNTAYDSGTGCDGESRSLTLQQSGTWQVRYTFMAYIGTISVEAYYFNEVA